MKFLKLRIENRRKFFYNNCRQIVYIHNGLNLNFQGRGACPGWPQGEAFPWRGCFY
nr:MAG TPA: hypothetical protein [Caudoviricetes sp.]